MKPFPAAIYRPASFVFGDVIVTRNKRSIEVHFIVEPESAQSYHGKELIKKFKGGTDERQHFSKNDGTMDNDLHFTKWEKTIFMDIVQNFTFRIVSNTTTYNRNWLKRYFPPSSHVCH